MSDGFVYYAVVSCPFDHMRRAKHARSGLPQNLMDMRVISDAPEGNGPNGKPVWLNLWEQQLNDGAQRDTVRNRKEPRPGPGAIRTAYITIGGGGPGCKTERDLTGLGEGWLDVPYSEHRKMEIDEFENLCEWLKAGNRESGEQDW